MGGGGNSGMKRCQSSMAFSTAVKKEDSFGELEPSSLFLSSSPTGVADERLYLPRRDTAPCSLDVYLQSIPSVTSRVDQLFEQQETSTLKKVASSQKCLTVLQGEVAHASEAQTDLLVSAEATTCHVVALRSTHPKSSAALASMAHIDEPDVYEECLEKMVQEHLQHHVKQAVEDGDDDFGFFMDDESDDESDVLHTEPTPTHHQHRRTPSYLPQPDFHSSNTTRSQSMPSLLDGERIEMELHIAGGYLDEDGTSQGLSTSLIHSFSQLAYKYQDKLKISLSTAAISSMNTTTLSDGSLKQRPRSRGLALNTHTGEVTPVTTALPQELEGPALEVRNARLFSSNEQRQLAVIHNSTSDGITIQPFTYQAQPQLNALLKVPDPVLLKVTSTSPDCESERFCSDLRRTLSFVNTVPAEQVFSSSKPLVYSRSSNALNEWEPVA